MDLHPSPEQALGPQPIPVDSEPENGTENEPEEACMAPKITQEQARAFTSHLGQCLRRATSNPDRVVTLEEELGSQDEISLGSRGDESEQEINDSVPGEGDQDPSKHVSTSSFQDLLTAWIDSAGPGSTPYNTQGYADAHMHIDRSADYWKVEETLPAILEAAEKKYGIRDSDRCRLRFVIANFCDPEHFGTFGLINVSQDPRVFRGTPTEMAKSHEQTKAAQSLGPE